MKLLTDITTGKDNQTHDIARWAMFVNAAPYRPRYTIKPDDPEGPVAA